MKQQILDDPTRSEAEMAAVASAIHLGRIVNELVDLNKNLGMLDRTLAAVFSDP